MILELLIITSIVCYIIDISGFISSVKFGIAKILSMYMKMPISPDSFRLKPFDCSQCMTLWVCILYIALSNHLSLYSISLCFLCSYLAISITSVLNLILDIVSTIINKLNRILYDFDKRSTG